MKLVGRVSKRSLEGGKLLRVAYPPYHVLITLVDGQPHAIEDACNHAGASLAEGDREGDSVICPLHGYVFDLRTGNLLAPEGLCENQRRFQVVASGDDFLIFDPFDLKLF